MVSDTQLELFGSACTTYQAPAASLNLEFPCDLIIIVDKP
jgi:hypothetical protein